MPLILTAVTIPDMRTTFFVANFSHRTLPSSEDFTDWSIEPGVRVEVPHDLNLWPDGAPAPEVEILCQSNADPSYYRVFKRPAEVLEDQYTRTGLAYGGVYSESHWAGLMERLPQILRFCRLPDTDPSQVVDPLRKPTAVGS